MTGRSFDLLGYNVVYAKFDWFFLLSFLSFPEGGATKALKIFFFFFLFFLCQDDDKSSHWRKACVLSFVCFLWASKLFISHRFFLWINTWSASQPKPSCFFFPLWMNNPSFLWQTPTTCWRKRHLYYLIVLCNIKTFYWPHMNDWANLKSFILCFCSCSSKYLRPWALCFRLPVFVLISLKADIQPRPDFTWFLLFPLPVHLGLSVPMSLTVNRLTSHVLVPSLVSSPLLWCCFLDLEWFFRFLPVCLGFVCIGLASGFDLCRLLLTLHDPLYKTKILN